MREANSDKQEVVAPVYAFVEAYERGDLDAILELWTPDAINHAGLTPAAEREARAASRLPAGREGLRVVFTSLLTAFPDRKWHIEEILVDGDKVICRFTVSGTHTGRPQFPVEGGPLLQQIEPRSMAYSIAHIHIFRVEDGKLAEHWAVRDDLGLLRQLGAFPVDRS